MEAIELPITALALQGSLNAVLVGSGTEEINALSPLEDVSPGRLAYLDNRQLAAKLPSLEGGVVLTRKEFLREDLPITFLLVDEPQRVFAQLAQTLRAQPPKVRGISGRAEVCASARFGESISVGPFAVISQNVQVGSGSTVGAHSYIGEGVTIGEGCEIYPHAVLLPGVKIGNRVKIFPGAVIGTEGFGIFRSSSQEGNMEMPQLGTVVVEDDVRIGANVTIARATFGETRIGAGTKIDDQVHVAHNVTVGKNNIFCAQAGIAGSCILEDDVVLAGQAGIGDNVRMHRGVQLGGGAGTTRDLREPGTYFLNPALPMRTASRVIRYMHKLPEIWRRVRALEDKVFSDEEIGGSND